MTETDSLIERYCNSTTPDNLIVEGNELYVKFASDISLQHNGFRFTWNAVQAGKKVQRFIASHEKWMNHNRLLSGFELVVQKLIECGCYFLVICRNAKCFVLIGA